MNSVPIALNIVLVCLGLDLWVWSVLEFHFEKDPGKYFVSAIGMAFLLTAAWNLVCLLSNLGLIHVTL
jgi:hypothetical protein